MADVTPTTAPQDDDAAWGAQYDQQQAAAKSQELLPKQEAPHPFQAVSNWVSSLPNRISSAVLDQAVPAVESVYNSKLGRADRDIVAGATTGVKNVADAAVGVVNKASRLLQPMAEAQGAPAAQTDVISEPIWSHAKSTVQDFTDAVKVKDPGIADNLLQYTAQVAPSYLLAGRLLNELHGVANVVASGAAADASALDPHAPRFADILGVLKQTDGKIGAALKAAGPYGLNAYINYLGSNGNETEAQGRFKNALDGILPNFIGTELLHAAGITVKQGYAGLRYMVDNGVASAGDLGAKSAASQRGGPKMVENNASGESAASFEAQNRPKRNLDLVDPDGNGTPVLKDVTQVDQQAPKGHLIIDRDTGEIVSRGSDLKEAHARGLRARYESKLFVEKGK